MICATDDLLSGEGRPAAGSAVAMGRAPGSPLKRDWPFPAGDQALSVTGMLMQLRPRGTGGSAAAGVLVLNRVDWLPSGVSGGGAAVARSLPKRLRNAPWAGGDATAGGPLRARRLLVRKRAPSAAAVAAAHSLPPAPALLPSPTAARISVSSSEQGAANAAAGVPARSKLALLPSPGAPCRPPDGADESAGAGARSPGPVTS